MKLEDIKLGVSPLTDTVFMGTVSKRDPGLWLVKREATSELCRALLTWVPPGSIRTIRGSNGKSYEIEVREVQPASEGGGLTQCDMHEDESY